MSPTENHGKVAFATAVERWLSSGALWAFRRPFVAIAVVGALLGAASFGTSRLRLDPDLSGLLPRTFESVRNVEALRERFGGSGYVVVMVTGGSRDGRRRVADTLAPELERLPTVRSVSARLPVAFFEDRALYFLEKEDLLRLRDDLEARQSYEIQRAQLDLALDEPPPLDFSDLRRKYEAKLGSTTGRGNPDGYHEDDQRLAVLVSPTELASDLAFSRRVVADVESTVARITPALLEPGATIELAGRYKKRVDLQAVLGKDLARTSSVALLLVIGYVAFHFRRVSATVLVMAPIVVGAGLTYGMAGFAFGTLNVLTAFIAAILLGIGVDNGIHLLGRYDEARLDGLSPEAAVAHAFSEAGRVSLTAALTTGVAFACLTVSEFRAFREFGVLAGSGLLLVLLSYLLLLPAQLSLLQRYLPRLSVPGNLPRLPGVPLARRLAPRLALGLGLLTLGLSAGAPALRFNADFSALDRADLPSFRLDPVVNELVGRSQTPLVYLAASSTQARAVASNLRLHMDALGSGRTVGSVTTLDDLVPQDQADKRPVLQRIGRILSRLRPVTPEERDRVEQLTRMARAETFTANELPASVRNQLEPRAGRGGAAPVHFVLAYPTVSMGDATAVTKLAEQLRGIDAGNGEHLSAAGEPMVLADILALVRRDGPRILLLTGLLVFVTLRVLAGSTRLALWSLAPALLSLGATAGLLPILGIELNYLNMILLPILLGVGVDDGMHVVTRVAAGEPLETVWANTGFAILGAILTDIFGFGALALAAHPGLASLGHVAIVGLTVNLVVCVVLLPAVLASGWFGGSRAPPSVPPLPAPLREHASE